MSAEPTSYSPPSVVAMVQELERIVADVRGIAGRYGNHAADAFSGETVFTDLQLALGPVYALRSLVD